MEISLKMLFPAKLEVALMAIMGAKPFKIIGELELFFLFFKVLK